MRIMISHYKDPYKTTRISWKVRDPGFFSWLICSPEADELQPDVMSFTAVIGAHARGSCVEGAREVFLGKHLFMQGTNQRVVVSTEFCHFHPETWGNHPI